MRQFSHDSEDLLGLITSLSFSFDPQFVEAEFYILSLISSSKVVSYRVSSGVGILV
jgi:hypothetical protein